MLNRGLKFKIPPKNPPLMDIVMNIESSLKFMNFNNHEKSVIRQYCKNSMNNGLFKIEHPSKTDIDVINELKAKDVYYLNFDKKVKGCI